jgi:hypothetical protein
VSNERPGLRRLVVVALATCTGSCLVSIPGLEPLPGDGGSESDASDAGSEVVVDATAEESSDSEVDGLPVDANAEDTALCASDTADCDGDMSNGCEDLATTPAHCGRCDHDCLGGDCLSGKCQPVVLASGVGAIQAIVKDAAFVYGTAAKGGSVWRAPVNGCPDPSGCAEVLSTPGTEYRDIATDGEGLFFTDEAEGRVARIGKDGQNECTLAGGVSSPIGIAVDDTYVYWCALGANVIRRRAKTCGGTSTSQTIVSGTAAPHFIRLDASGLYWTKRTGGLLSWAQVSGTPTEPVWAGSSPGGFMFSPALDDEWVYWREGREEPIGGSARIVRAPKNRSGLLEVLAEDQPSPRHVAVDESHVYWTSTESVRRIAKAGGTVETLATGFSSPHAIALDDEAVYFGTVVGQQLVKVAK